MSHTISFCCFLGVLLTHTLLSDVSSARQSPVILGSNVPEN